MKKYLGFILLIIQLFMFYVFPLFAGPTDAMGMVLILLLTTFVLGLLSGILKSRAKYSFPLIVAILFIPSIFIYYNSSALVHSLWYFIVSFLGLLIGSFLSHLTK